MTQIKFSEQHRHLVFATFQAWGHVRPLCALAARLVKARPVSITLFTTGSFYDRVNNEISRNFDSHESAIRAQIRVIALPSNEANPLDVASLNESFNKAYVGLIEERPLTCAKTDREIAPLPSPDAVILDIFGSEMMSSIRKHSSKDKTVKVYCWVSCSASALYYHWGPASHNKDGNAEVLIREEADRSGRPIPEVANKFLFSTAGNVIEVPGMPPIYDYEHYPQDLIFKDAPVGLIHMWGAAVVNGSDGVIIGTPQCYEPPETLANVHRWFAKTSREVHVIGPMLPTTSHANATEKEQSTKSQEIDNFMSRILESHGPKSMLYISFGSVWWSTEPVKIWTFLDILMERNVPFILSHGSPFAQIPDDVRDKVNASGLGLLSPWSPQQYILAHPVTGWFVTHCGFNGIIESVSSGIPMITWPYQADQPVNSWHLTDNLDIAYELLEVRTGHGLKPIYRTGITPSGTLDAIRVETNRVLDQAFGDDGKRKRANVEKLRDSLSQVWTEQGSSQLALERLLDTVYTA